MALLMDEREGADITAADMVTLPTEPSKIQEYFTGTTIFVTGGTGFLGQLLIEKLLRTCKDLRKIYILIRPKADQNCQERFQQYFDSILYEKLKREHPQALYKLCLIIGDCSLPNLGIDDNSKETLINEVNCVFHCAATTRMDEKLRKAALTNVRGTREILNLSKMMKNMWSFVYVSTAYSFCSRQEIKETFYNSILTANQLMTIVETVNDNMLDRITPMLIDKWPNTCTFTKSIAENDIRSSSANLPIAVVRPSLIISTVEEPLAGWVNNKNGPTSICAGIVVGLIHTLRCEPNYLADLIPADYVVNTIIAAAWDIAEQKSLNLNAEVVKPDMLTSEDTEIETDIPIYNVVSGAQNPISWGQYIDLCIYHFQDIPLAVQFWHNFFFLTPNKHLYLIQNFILHTIPSYILDFFLICIRRKPMLKNVYKKIKNYLRVLEYFYCNQWAFRNNNTIKLWEKLNIEDQKAFEFSMAKFDWNLYFPTHVKGIRVYIIQDPLDTIPRGHKVGLGLRIANYFVLAFLCTALFIFLWYIFFGFSQELFYLL